RAPPPRRRRAVRRAAGPWPTPRRGLRARPPCRALWREWSTSDLHYYRKDHRPAVGAVVDELTDLVVQVLLEELDLADVVLQGPLQHAVRLVAHLLHW